MDHEICLDCGVAASIGCDFVVQQLRPKWRPSKAASGSAERLVMTAVVENIGYCKGYQDKDAAFVQLRLRSLRLRTLMLRSLMRRSFDEDFTPTITTVNTLLGLWSFLTSHALQVELRQTMLEMCWKHCNLYLTDDRPHQLPILTF